MSKKKTPKTDKPLTQSRIEAESVDYNLYFHWQGLDFVIDPSSMGMGRWTYALRRVNNMTLPPLDRISAAIDCWEATLGEAQVATLAAAYPAIFDDERLIESFWDAFIATVHGAKPGESSAS